MSRKVGFLILVLLMCFGLAACETLKIGDIVADPGRFHDKEVTVAGRVVTSVGALGKGIYEIDDGTGKLWVYSDTHGVPSKGAMVGVKGRILPTFTFLGQNYATVMRESDRRARNGD